MNSFQRLENRYFLVQHESSIIYIMDLNLKKRRFLDTKESGSNILNIGKQNIIQYESMIFYIIDSGSNIVYIKTNISKI